MPKFDVRVELRNHPAIAQVKHPVTGQPMQVTDAHGNPEPLIKDQHGIFVSLWRDDEFLEDDPFVLYGYCGTTPNKPLSLVRHVEPFIAEAIYAHVREKIGPVLGDRATMPPKPPSEPQEDDDDE
jgi:hypothetical protein